MSYTHTEGRIYRLPMSDEFQPPSFSWVRKFTRAAGGAIWALRTQSSCYVHALATIGVIAAGWWLGVSRLGWCLLILCITCVWCAELMNTGIEILARQVDRRTNPEIGRALDVASGAVLCMAAGAAVVGLLVLVPHLMEVAGRIAEW